MVTTGTFGAMCSSGAFINFGHSDPPIRMTNIMMNGVEAYGGLAAVDTYIGATAKAEGRGYGGAHVIEDLIAGKKIHLHAWGPGSHAQIDSISKRIMHFANRPVTINLFNHYLIIFQLQKNKFILRSFILYFKTKR